MSNELIEAMARAMDCALAFEVEGDVRAGELTHEERCAVAKAAYAAIADRVVVKVDLAEARDKALEEAALWIERNGPSDDIGNYDAAHGLRALKGSQQ